MEVIRHPTTGGAPVEFQFRASGSRFLVKNFTSGYITCGILDAEVTIPANTSQVIAHPADSPHLRHDRQGHRHRERNQCDGS